MNASFKRHSYVVKSQRKLQDQNYFNVLCITLTSVIHKLLCIKNQIVWKYFNNWKSMPCCNCIIVNVPTNTKINCKHLRTYQSLSDGVIKFKSFFIYIKSDIIFSIKIFLTILHKPSFKIIQGRYNKERKLSNRCDMVRDVYTERDRKKQEETYKLD